MLHKEKKDFNILSIGGYVFILIVMFYLLLVKGNKVLYINIIISTVAIVIFLAGYIYNKKLKVESENYYKDKLKLLKIKAISEVLNFTSYGIFLLFIISDSIPLVIIVGIFLIIIYANSFLEYKKKSKKYKSFD